MNLQSFLSRVVSPLVLLSALAIVWLPPYFVSQDGPSLMYISSWFSFQQQPIHEYLQPNYHLQPNWVAPLLSGFLLNFFDGNTAEKVLATLYLLAFLFGAKALVSVIARAEENDYVKENDDSPKQPPKTDDGAIGNQGEIASGKPRNDGRGVTLSGVEGWLLLAPLAIGQAFFKGFYNNNFSVAALLWFLYFYEKYKQNHGARNLWICGGLMLFIFFSQPLPLLPLFALLGFDFLKRKELRMPILFIAILPIVLLANWVIQSPSEVPIWRPFMHQFGDLLKGDFLNSFGFPDQVVAFCFYLILLLAFCILFWQKRNEPVIARAEENAHLKEHTISPKQSPMRKILAVINDSYFFVAVFLLLLYFIFPSNAAGGGLINIRLALLCVLFFILFLVRNIQPISSLNWVSLAAGLLFLVFSFQLVKMEYKLSAEVEDMRHLCAEVEHGKHIGSMGEWEQSLFAKLELPCKIPILQHAPFLISHEQHLLSYECHFGMVSYYPIRYKNLKLISGFLIYQRGVSPFDYFLTWNENTLASEKDYRKKSTIGHWTLYSK